MNRKHIALIAVGVLSTVSLSATLGAVGGAAIVERNAERDAKWARDESAAKVTCMVGSAKTKGGLVVGTDTDAYTCVSAVMGDWHGYRPKPTYVNGVAEGEGR